MLIQFIVEEKDVCLMNGTVTVRLAHTEKKYFKIDYRPKCTSYTNNYIKKKRKYLRLRVRQRFLIY